MNGKHASTPASVSVGRWPVVSPEVLTKHGEGR
jgi:hypothetical protein